MRVEAGCQRKKVGGLVKIHTAKVRTLKRGNLRSARKALFKQRKSALANFEGNPLSG